MRRSHFASNPLDEERARGIKLALSERRHVSGASAGVDRASTGQHSGQENEQGDRYFYGRGVEQDYAKAMEWYRKAADQQLADAQHNIGALYENGWGVAKDLDQAKVWYQKAANNGDAFAKAALQRLEPPQNPSEQTTSATQPTPNAPTTALAQYERGNDYNYGRGGVEQDHQVAMYWYQKAADHGYAEAQYALGLLYENGVGVEKDFSKAKAWYQKAADQRNTDAQAGLRRLGSVGSVKITNASCSRIDDGAFKVEMSGEVTAPDECFLACCIPLPPHPTEHVPFEMPGLGRNRGRGPE